MMKRVLMIVLTLMLFSVGCTYDSKDKKEEAIVAEDSVVEEESIDTADETEVTGEFDIEVGKLTPDFTLKDLDGEEVSLSDYRGKIVLINFWATWCKWCDVEMPDLQKLDDENDDIVVLAVDVMEEKETVKKYLEDGGYDFQVVLDEDGEISRTFLVSGLPTSYFVDKEGILLGGVPSMMTYDQMILILEDIRSKE